MASINPPRLENGKPMLIAGLREQIKTIASIPALWQRALAHKIPNRLTPIDYGVVFNCFPGSESFDYLAGAEVSAATKPPGFTHVSIQAHKFLVFQHTGHVSKLCETIEAINKWLPESGYKAPPPSPGTPNFFERYGEDFNPQTGMGGMEVWFPIEA